MLSCLSLFCVRKNPRLHSTLNVFGICGHQASSPYNLWALYDCTRIVRWLVSVPPAACAAPKPRDEPRWSSWSTTWTEFWNCTWGLGPLSQPLLRRSERLRIECGKALECIGIGIDGERFCYSCNSWGRCWCFRRSYVTYSSKVTRLFKCLFSFHPATDEAKLTILAMAWTDLSPQELAPHTLYGPFGASFSLGRVVVADSCNHRCLVLTLNGQVLFEFGSRGFGPGQFESPECVAAFHDGYIAVSDKDNHRIQVFNENGQFHHFIPKDWTASYFDPLKPGSLLGPMGMCVDRHDRLFVADCGSDRVQIFSREGDFLWCSPTKPDSAAGFWFQSPTAMAADDQGLVYVASDHCVQVFWSTRHKCPSISYYISASPLLKRPWDKSRWRTVRFTQTRKTHLRPSSTKSRVGRMIPSP